MKYVKKALSLLLVCVLLFTTLSVNVWTVVEAIEQLAVGRQSQLMGDITNDGKMNIADAAELYAHVRGLKPHADAVLARCDLNGDGWINVADVSMLYTQVRGAVELDELQLYAKEIQQAQTSTTLTLAMMSDAHYCGHDRVPQPEKLETAGAMARLSGYLDVDALVNLGDMVPGNEEKEKTLEDIKQLMEATERNAQCPVLYVRGNHDDNGWYSREEDGYPGVGSPDQIMDHDEWYQQAFGSASAYVVTDSNNPTGGYGYFDHEDSKIRVFLLNTSDIPYILQEDGTYRYNAYECNAFSNAQLNFVARSLLFEDKEVPNDWAAMFLMHVPMDTSVLNGYRFGAANTLIRGYTQMLSIIDAYRKGISYSFTGSVYDNASGIELAEHFQVSVSGDYTSKGCGDVIAFVNGHTHIDNASRQVGFEYSLSYGYTYLSVVGSDSFTTMVVDREKSVVSVFKYGQGRGPSQSTDPQIIQKGNVLVANGEEEFGIDFSAHKQWVIPFQQFRPRGENLVEETGAVALDGYKLPSLPAALSLDPETMLPEEVIEAKNYAISKPILLRQNTQYVIPDIGKSMVHIFHHTRLSRSKSMTPVKMGDEMILTGISYAGCYIVIVFDKRSYPDYENFYIKERVHSDVPPEIIPPAGGPVVSDTPIPDTSTPDTPPETVEPIEGNLFNGMSECWGDGYLIDTTATLDSERLEVLSATVNSKYAISKAVALEANTVYEIPQSVSNKGLTGVTIYFYQSGGTFNGTAVLSDGDGCKTFTSKSSGGYAVFCFNKNIYSDFDNFYVIEHVSDDVPPEVEAPTVEPMEGNLFNGMSECWGDGYFIDTTAKLDLERLEVLNATANSKYAISKAVALEADTVYAIPENVINKGLNGVTIYFYHSRGGFNGTAVLSDEDGCKTFTSKSSGGYAVFCFNKNIYSDFDKFYVIEFTPGDAA